MASLSNSLTHCRARSPEVLGLAKKNPLLHETDALHKPATVYRSEVLS